MNALLANRRELAVAEEGSSTPGTPVNPSFDGTASRYYIYDAKFSVGTETFQRKPQRKTLSALAALVGKRMATLTFKVEVRRTASGTTLDAWGSLLKACACDEDNAATDVDYTPESSPSNYTTLTMWLNIDGVRLGIAGAMGNCVFTGNVGEPMMAEFTFSGVYIGAADQAISDIDTPETGIPSVFQGVAFTYGGNSYCFSSATLNLGNDVQERPCANESEGIQSFLVTGREPTLSFDPEAQLVATEDFHDDFHGAVLKAVTWTFDGITFTVPKFQITGISDDERNGVAVYGLSGLCTANSETGDDEWSINMT